MDDIGAVPLKRRAWVPGEETEQEVSSGERLPGEGDQDSISTHQIASADAFPFPPNNTLEHIHRHRQKDRKTHTHTHTHTYIHTYRQRDRHTHTHTHAGSLKKHTVTMRKLLRI